MLHLSSLRSYYIIILWRSKILLPCGTNIRISDHTDNVFWYLYYVRTYTRTRLADLRFLCVSRVSIRIMYTLAAYYNVYNIMYLVEKLVVCYCMSWCRHDEQYDSSGLFRSCAKNNTNKNSLGLCTSTVRGCCAPNICHLGGWRVEQDLLLPPADSHGYNIVGDRWTIHNITLYYGCREMGENENLFEILYIIILYDRFND